MSEHWELIKEARAQVAYMTSLAPDGMRHVEPGSMIYFVVKLAAALESLPTPPVAGEPAFEEPCPGCTGSDDCPAPAHQHGCFADLVGHCNEPEAHAEVAGEPEREALAGAIKAERAAATMVELFPKIEYVAACTVARRNTDKLLAVYRRQPEPREVTTVEELDALPVGTLIREYDGFSRLKEGKWSWILCVPGGGLGASDEIECPVTVLFTPSAEETS